MPRTAGWSTVLSFGTLLTTECRTCFTNALVLQISFFSFLQVDNETIRTFREGGAMEWPACGILSGSSCWAHPSPYHSFISAHTCLVFLLHFHPTSSLLSPIPRPGLSTETIYQVFILLQHFLFIEILLMISPGLSLCTSLLRLLLPSSLHIMIINSQSLLPLSLTHYSHPLPFPRSLLSRFWNSVATYAWLGLALAVSCAFYAVFASPSQDKLSGLWGGCSFTFHYCFTTFTLEKYLLEGLPST